MDAMMTGTRAIVSGAAGGVGKATVRKLLALGARERRGRRDRGGRGADVERIFALAERSFGGVDCLVSNAACSWWTGGYTAR